MAGFVAGGLSKQVHQSRLYGMIAAIRVAHGSLLWLQVNGLTPGAYHGWHVLPTACHRHSGTYFLYGSEYPTGTSKWNPIEHRLFSEISKTWQGCPLRSFAVMLQYLEHTTTQTGLRVRAHLITTSYATGEKVSDAEMATLNIQYHKVCPQWNYTLYPRASSSS
jgi:hypothetical protein